MKNSIYGENSSGSKDIKSSKRSRSSCLYVILGFIFLGIIIASFSDCGKLDILIGRSGCLESFDVGGQWNPEYLALSSDEQVFAIWYTYDGLRLWDASSGRLRNHIPFEHPDSVTVGDMVFSSDGKLLRFVYKDGSSNSLIVLSIPVENPENRKQHVFEDVLNYSLDPAISLSPDGILVAYEVDTGSIENEQNVIIIGDISSESIIQKLDDPGVKSAIAFSPDGKLLAVGFEGNIQLWQVNGFQMLRQFNSDSSGMRTLEFSPDGGILASLKPNGEVQLWDVNDGSIIHSFRYEEDLIYGHPNIAFSPDGRRLAISSCRVNIYSLPDASLLMTHPKIFVSLNPNDIGAILCNSNIAFAPDGKSFYYVENRVLKKWRVP